MTGRFRRLPPLLLTAAAASAVFTFVARPTIIDGDSMSPTLPNGSLIVVDRLRPALGWTPAHGDVVALTLPTEGRPRVVKRVVAVAHDRVAFDALGRLAVNGRPSPKEAQGPSSGAPGYREVVIADGYCFVVGDNRLHSTDSRHVGQVGTAGVFGRCVLRLWPLAAPAGND